MGLGGYGVMGLKSNLYLHKLRLGRPLAHYRIATLPY